MNKRLGLLNLLKTEPKNVQENVVKNGISHISNEANEKGRQDDILDRKSMVVLKKE